LKGKKIGADGDGNTRVKIAKPSLFAPIKGGDVSETLDEGTRKGGFHKRGEREDRNPVELWQISGPAEFSLGSIR